MVWLANALGTLVMSIIGWFATQGAKKVALVSAGLAALGTALSVLLSALGGYLSQISADLLPPAIVEPGLALLPSNTALCISLILSSRASRLVLDWTVRSIDISTKAS